MFGKSCLSLFPATLLLATVFAAAPAGAALVANGDFETGTFSGWSPIGNVVLDGSSANAFVISDSPVPQGGSLYGASFGSIGALGGITQSFATTAGVTYTVDFWLQNEADALGVYLPNEFQFTWGGSVVASLQDSAPFDYQHFSYDLIATSAMTSIGFSFRNDPAFWDLDNVAVTPVPEPQTWALMGLGFAALAASRKRALSRR